MARGTANNEPVVSQANNKAYEEGYTRALGDKPPQRGRWVYDERHQCLVPAGEYAPPSRALDAPVMSGRFYENTKAVDGADIGSRAKYQRYMRERGVTASSDFSPGWYESQRRQQKREVDRGRRETLDRAFHGIAEGRIKPKRRPQE